jgi:hypothetical protein
MVLAAVLFSESLAVQEPKNFAKKIVTPYFLKKE